MPYIALIEIEANSLEEINRIKLKYGKKFKRVVKITGEDGYAILKREKKPPEMVKNEKIKIDKQNPVEAKKSKKISILKEFQEQLCSLLPGHGGGANMGTKNSHQLKT